MLRRDDPTNQPNHQYTAGVDTAPMATDTASADSTIDKVDSTTDTNPVAGPTTRDYDGKEVGYPPADPGPERLAWFQEQLREHTNGATKRPWTQADIARGAECVEAHVNLVLSGKRQTGDVTKRIQRVVAAALRRSQADLFGQVCTGCPKCGTKHAPKRIMAVEP